MKSVKDKYHKQWEKLGASDPYWAVLNDSTKKGGKWNADDFFDIGEKEIHNFFQKLYGLGVQVKFGTALDFGCGVGRLSRALSKRFRKIIAVDISRAMLNEAQKANQHIANINFLYNPEYDLRAIQDNSVDFLYSNIVLQHIPKMKQIKYIKEFCRVLRPKGVLAFQAPATYNLKSWKGWLFRLTCHCILNILRKIKNGPAGIMEMHVIPKKTVLEALKREGMSIVDAQWNNSAGPAFESYMYIAKKG